MAALPVRRILAATDFSAVGVAVVAPAMLGERPGARLDLGAVANEVLRTAPGPVLLLGPQAA